jgi:hypothetical protein
MPLQNFVSKIVSYFPGLDRQSIRREFRHAFRVSTSDENSTLNEKELALISRLITIIQKRKLTTPATLFLESAQPLNYIGSQLMVFFRPFLTFLFTPADYDLLQGILEKREGIKKVIEELEKRQ